MARLKWWQSCGARMIEIVAYMIIAVLVLLAFLYVVQACWPVDPTPTPTKEATSEPTATYTASPTIRPEPTVHTPEPSKQPTVTATRTAVPTDAKPTEVDYPTVEPTVCPWCYPWTGGCLCHQDVEFCLCGDSDNHCSSCEKPEREGRTSDDRRGAGDRSSVGVESIEPYPGPIVTVDPYPGPGAWEPVCWPWVEQALCKDDG